MFSRGRIYFGPRKTLWRTNPTTKKQTNQLVQNHNVIPNAGNADQSPNGGMSFTMIFASIFGSFLGIALISRMFGPRRVEVIHKNEPAQMYPNGQFPPPGPYRSV
jgi:hypothetical protein